MKVSLYALIGGRNRGQGAAIHSMLREYDRCMPRALVFICIACAARCAAQSASAGPALAAILNFESQPATGRLSGWGGSSDAAFGDNEIVHSGKWAARI